MFYGEFGSSEMHLRHTSTLIQPAIENFENKWRRMAIFMANSALSLTNRHFRHINGHHHPPREIMGYQYWVPMPTLSKATDAPCDTDSDWYP